METLEDIRKKCYKKLNDLKLDSDKYKKTLEEELIEIDQQDLVQDYIEYISKYAENPLKVNKNGILVAYLLDICTVDPIKSNIEPSYFLGKCPDIDIDIVEELSDYVEERLKKKYGTEHVSHICTHPKYTAKNLVKDLIRTMVPRDNPCYGFFKPQEALGEAIDSIGDIEPETFAEELQKKLNEPETPAEARELFFDPEVREVIVTLLPKLAGQVRSVGQHPAGVIITPQPTYTQIPVQRLGGQRGSIVTGIDGDEISFIGFLKIDILKTDCTKIIAETVDLVKKTKGKDLTDEIYRIDLEDKRILAEFNAARTHEIFQFNSNVCQNALKVLTIKKFLDLSIVNAVVRPGASIAIPELQVNMKDPSQVKYLHHAFEEIFAETYGSMVYQEQVMWVFNKIAGLDLGVAGNVEELMRKKISKMVAKGKTREEILQTTEGKKYLGYEKKLKEATRKLGIDDEELDKFIMKMQQFMAYSFNKAHSVAYSFAAYIEMWLKMNYPEEFYCSLLNSTVQSGASDKIARLMTYIANAKKHISLKGIDINNLHRFFSLDDEGNLYAGCNLIKGASVSEIEALKDAGPYNSLTDFFAKLCFIKIKKGKTFGRVSKRTLQPLIELGALRKFGKRQQILDYYELFSKFISLHGNSLNDYYQKVESGEIEIKKHTECREMDIIREYHQWYFLDKIKSKSWQCLLLVDFFSKVFEKNIVHGGKDFCKVFYDAAVYLEENSADLLNADDYETIFKRIGKISKAKFGSLESCYEDGLTLEDIIEKHDKDLIKKELEKTMIFQDIFNPRKCILEKYEKTITFTRVKEMKNAELELFGFYLLTNPVEPFERKNEENNLLWFQPLDYYSAADADDGRPTLGIVSGITQRKIKNGKNAGKPYSVVTITNLKTNMTFTIWPDDYKGELKDGDIIRVWLKHTNFGYSMCKYRPDGKPGPGLIVQGYKEEHD